MPRLINVSGAAVLLVFHNLYLLNPNLPLRSFHLYPICKPVGKFGSSIRWAGDPESRVVFTNRRHFDP